MSKIAHGITKTTGGKVHLDPKYAHPEFLGKEKIVYTWDDPRPLTEDMFRHMVDDQISTAFLAAQMLEENAAFVSDYMLNVLNKKPEARFPIHIQYFGNLPNGKLLTYDAASGFLRCSVKNWLDVVECSDDLLRALAENAEAGYSLVFQSDDKVIALPKAESIWFNQVTGPGHPVKATAKITGIFTESKELEIFIRGCRRARCLRAKCDEATIRKLTSLKKLDFPIFVMLEYHEKSALSPLQKRRDDVYIERILDIIDEEEANPQSQLDLDPRDL